MPRRMRTIKWLSETVDAEFICGGRRMYLWCAVNDEGEVLDVVVKRRRDT
ncbi:transposase-like protein [Brevundimonas terrae]|nr:transposase-like protein [Brevundimonas terrae]